MPTLENDQSPFPISNPTKPPKTNKQPSTSHPFTLLTTYLPFPTPSQKQWWLDSASLLSRMLSAAKYTPDEQYTHLLSFHRHILPYFGPHPLRWPSLISGSGLPVEYSLNFQNNADPVIRIAFEPISFEAGSARDPFNKRALEELVSGAVEHNVSGFDTALLDHFKETLFLNDSDVHRISDLDPHFPRTHSALGFDLKGNKTVIKGYVHPGWRSRATGIPVNDLIRSSLDGIQDSFNCREAIELVHGYMESSGGYDLRTFLAWDCTPLHASRIKIYGIDNDVSLGKIEELWTMGWRLTDDAALDGLKHLRRLWRFLDINGAIERSTHYDEKHEDADCANGNTNGANTSNCSTSQMEETPKTQAKVDRRLPLFWNYEVKSGSTRIAPKIYFPVYGENDFKVCLALSRFFASLGWDDKASGYVDLVRGLYPGIDIADATRLQCLISFAYSAEKGVYMSVYYHSTSSYE
ncbi:aromatic prenyltransferase [Aspergillus stella-maris]|uniref:aromatic prenyltransferase n=1 Tax=Aspergillus stella-maris TaxID=1810926 RepID=UPI003CCCE692